MPKPRNRLPNRYREAVARTYPSVNAMLRGTMSSEAANATIDGMQDQLTESNLKLSAALQALIEGVTTDSPATVRCPDRGVRDRARRALKRYGVWIERADP